MQDLTLQESREVVLRAMRHRVERRHQDYHVQEEPGMKLYRIPYTLPEADPTGFSFMILVRPDLGLWHAPPNQEDHQGGKGPHHEHGPPTQAKDIEDAEEDKGPEQIAKGVALLQEPREEAARLGRQRLHG